MLSYCEFDRHIVMLSSCEFDIHVAFDRHIVVLSSCELDIHMDRYMVMLSSCEFDIHVAFDRHIVVLSSGEFDGHIAMLSSWVRQTNLHVVNEPTFDRANIARTCLQNTTNMLASNHAICVTIARNGLQNRHALCIDVRLCKNIARMGLQKTAKCEMHWWTSSRRQLAPFFSDNLHFEHFDNKSYPSQTKILEGRTNLSECVFETIFNDS